MHCQARFESMGPFFHGIFSCGEIEASDARQKGRARAQWDWGLILAEELAFHRFRLRKSAVFQVGTVSDNHRGGLLCLLVMGDEWVL